MSRDRRRDLIDLVGTYDIIYVEDAPYRKLRFESEEVPPVKSMDDSGNVVFLGTYSKLVCPGIRVGWMVADEAILERVIPMKEDGGTSPYMQMILRELHLDGYVTERAREYADFLRGQRDATVAAIEEHLPAASVYYEPKGGYYLWVELPNGVDTAELLDVAKKEGVWYLPGEIFRPEDGSNNFLRISWAYEDHNSIEEGIRRLGRALDAYQDALG